MHKYSFVGKFLGVNKEAREAAIEKLDDAGLTVQSCALRAALAVDGQFQVERQRNDSDLGCFDVADTSEARPHFRSASSSGSSAFLGCNACGQVVQMQEVASGDDNGTFRLRTSFPPQCPAYSD